MMLTVCCYILVVCCIALMAALASVYKQMKELRRIFDVLSLFSKKQIEEHQSDE